MFVRKLSFLRKQKRKHVWSMNESCKWVSTCSKKRWLEASWSIHLSSRLPSPLLFIYHQIQVSAIFFTNFLFILKRAEKDLYSNPPIIKRRILGQQWNNKKIVRVLFVPAFGYTNYIETDTKATIEGNSIFYPAISLMPYNNSFRASACWVAFHVYNRSIRHIGHVLL